MVGYFEQFVAFGTDIVGLERLMRLTQSIFNILTFYPALIPMLLSQQPSTVHKASKLLMLELSGHLNLTRRAIRLFWCLSSFQSGWNAYVAPEKNIEMWLAILANAFFGLFGLIESITLPDLLQVKHLSIFGFDEAIRLICQSQGLWLAALACSALNSSFSIFRICAYRAAPEMENSFSPGKEAENKSKDATRKGKQEMDVVAEETSRKSRRLARKLLAEVLDIVIPVRSTGLVNVDLGTVSIAMLCSTILMGYAVWERCGQAIERRHAHRSGGGLNS